MATYFLDSVGGNDANGGTSWADAKATLAGADGLLTAAGDVLKVEYRHSEAPAATTTYTFPGGTKANPNLIVSVDKDASDAYRTGASILASAAGYYSIHLDGYISVYGMTIGASGLLRLLYAGLNVYQYFYQCTLSLTKSDNLGSTGSVGYLVGYSTSYRNTEGVFEKCTLDMSAVTGTVSTATSAVRFSGASISRWRDLTIIQPTNPDCPLFGAHGSYPILSVLHVQDSDLSSFQNICRADSRALHAHLRRCKVHATYVLGYGTFLDSVNRFTIENSQSGTISVPALGLGTTTQKGVESYFGSIKTVTAQYRTGGASDGITANYAWEMITTANVKESIAALESPPMSAWVDPDATPTGATAEGLFQSTRAAPLATPVALLTRFGTPSASWQGVGWNTEYKITATIGDYTLTVYFAGPAAMNDDDFWIEVSAPDQVGGPVVVRCFLAVALTTVYVDPKLEIA